LVKRCKSSQGNRDELTGFSSQLKVHSLKGSELASNLLFQDDIKSFDLDKAMVDAYPEYCMLKKL